MDSEEHVCACVSWCVANVVAVTCEWCIYSGVWRNLIGTYEDVAIYSAVFHVCGDYGVIARVCRCYGNG